MLLALARSGFPCRFSAKHCQRRAFSSLTLNFEAPRQFSWHKFEQSNPNGEPAAVLEALRSLPPRWSFQASQSSDNANAGPDQWFNSLASHLAAECWRPGDLWAVLHLLSKQHRSSFRPSMQAACDAACAALVFRALYPAHNTDMGASAMWLPHNMRVCAVHMLLGLLQEATAVLHECLQLSGGSIAPSDVDNQLHRRAVSRCCDIIGTLCSELCSRRASVLRRAWLPMLSSGQLLLQAKQSGFQVPPHSLREIQSMCCSATGGLEAMRFPQVAAPPQLALVVGCMTRAAMLDDQPEASPLGDLREGALQVHQLPPASADRAVLLQCAIAHGGALHSRFVRPRLSPDGEHVASDSHHAAALRASIALARTPADKALSGYVGAALAAVASPREGAAFSALVLSAAWRRLSDMEEQDHSAGLLPWTALVAQNAALLGVLVTSPGPPRPGADAVEHSVMQFAHLAFGLDGVSASQTRSLHWPAPDHEAEVSFCLESLRSAAEWLGDACATSRQLHSLIAAAGIRASPSVLHQAVEDIRLLWALPAASLCGSILAGLGATSALGAWSQGRRGGDAHTHAHLQAALESTQANLERSLATGGALPGWQAVRQHALQAASAAAALSKSAPW